MIRGVTGAGGFSGPKYVSLKTGVTEVWICWILSVTSWRFKVLTMESLASLSGTVRTETTLKM